MAAQLIHEIIPVGLLQCNCSILGDPKTHDAIVVDPGDEVERIMEIVSRHQLKVRAIASTHTHIDHVGGLAKLRQLTNAPVLIHESDVELYRHLDLQAQWLGVPAPPVTNVDEFLREGDAISWGNFKALVLHTPGHTPGSVSLFLPKGASDDADVEGPKVLLERPRLLSGDTLFCGSIGRTDLWGGSFSEILRSIHHKLLTLPEETLVYPGHGPDDNDQPGEGVKPVSYSGLVISHHN